MARILQVFGILSWNKGKVCVVDIGEYNEYVVCLIGGFVRQVTKARTLLELQVFDILGRNKGKVCAFDLGSAMKVLLPCLMSWQVGKHDPDLQFLDVLS